MKYPDVENPELVGKYPAMSKAGGGFVWDAVLEYRVWCHPEEGGDDYYYAFESFEEALEFSEETPEVEEPLALIYQEEHINEPEPEKYVHVKEPRITEWRVEWLCRPRRTERTIPDFLAPDAPDNRMDILQGQAKPKRLNIVK